MNIFLEKFVKEKFKKPGKALDLGAGEFHDVDGLRNLGWNCRGVDKNIGIDLNFEYLADDGPFNLVFSNYVLHKIKKKKVFWENILNNLKVGGWVFIHTFDSSDKIGRTDLDEEKMKKILKEKGFENINTKVFDYYDNDPGHNHWHRIIEAIGQKNN